MSGNINQSFELEGSGQEHGDKNQNENDNMPGDFEKAITAAGWGKFHIFIHVISFISGFCSILETTTMSYVFPEAECDLDLELYHKGLLNAITYAGMISSAMIWGFLFDTLGRKKLLVIGSILDGLSVVASAASQNFAMLLTFKFLGGFITNGPYAALQVYLSEFHCSRHRALVQIMLGASMGCATLLLPIIAMWIMPLDLKWYITEHFVLHSWNVYLLLCSLPALLSGIAMMFLPESPKFLMTTGRTEEALRVFRMVYRINTGRDEDSYPIKELIDETAKHDSQSGNRYGGKVTANRSKKQAMLEGWQQIKPLFFPPRLKEMILVCTLMLSILMSLNTLRLWLPQLFQAINDYTATNTETASLCTMMETLKHKHATFNLTTVTTINETCTVNHDNRDVYINSMIVSAITVLGYAVAGTLINALGKKNLLVILGIASGSTAVSLYFARNNATTIALSSIFVAFGSVAINVVLAVVVDLFPTTLRTMTISITMMIGRSGSMIGNIFFPVLIASGCFPPFAFVGATMIACGLMALLLPNTEMKALE